jgi:hypothetical protein
MDTSADEPVVEPQSSPKEEPKIELAEEAAAAEAIPTPVDSNVTLSTKPRRRQLIDDDDDIAAEAEDSEATKEELPATVSVPNAPAAQNIIASDAYHADAAK